jgi:AbrB-like transcriptional regulator
MAKTTVKSDPKQSEKSKSGSTSSATNTDRSVEVAATIDSSDEGNTPNTPLTGKALLQKVKELSHLAKRETAKQCGYVKSTSSGGVRTDLSGFYDAVLTAKGVKLDETSRDSRGKVATYKATVHKNGQLLIGSAYTKGMGLKEGDTFTIKLGYKHIHLIQDEN